MNMQNEENLKELFEKFAEGEQAQRAVEDIQKGEQILRESAAPEPDGELIADIKAEIAARLLHKKENTFRRAAFKTLAVAAAFILVAVISVKLFERNGREPEKRAASRSVLPKAIWESDCLADDGENSATLVAEIEQIESDLLVLQSDENGSNGEALTELEIELTEINNDFWKG